jgi:hypothetical protein
MPCRRAVVGSTGAEDAAVCIVTVFVLACEILWGRSSYPSPALLRAACTRVEHVGRRCGGSQTCTCTRARLCVAHLALGIRCSPAGQQLIVLLHHLLPSSRLPPAAWLSWLPAKHTGWGGLAHARTSANQQAFSAGEVGG